MQPTLPSCQRRQMMTRWALLTLFFIGFAQFQGFAQTLYNFSNDSLGIPLAGPMGLTGSNLTRGAGVRASSAPCGPTQGLGSNGWPTTNTFDVGVFNTAGDFVEFTLTPAMGNGLKITGFSARSRRENLTGTDDDGPIAIRYGFRVGVGAWTTVNPGNPQSSNVCASGGVNRIWPSWADTLVSQPITFRIYGLSSGTSGRGDLFLRDVIVNGTVCASAPSISPSPANFLVCKGQTSYSMGYTLETGDTYSINYNPAANTAGFVDVANATLPVAPGVIPWTIPANAPAGNYNAVLTIANTCGFTTNYNVVVTVSALPNVHAVLSDTTICTGGSFTLSIQDSSLTGHTFHLIADLVDDDGITPLEFFNVPNGASLMLTEGVHFDGDINNIVSIKNISVEDETTHCVSYPSNRSITVLDLPRVSISLNDLAICDDGKVKLKFKDRDASGHLFTIKANVVHDLATFPILYTGVANGDSITYTEGIDFEGSMSGTVSLQNIVITDESTGCDTTLAPLSITVNPYPVASIAVAPVGSICPGSTIILGFYETAWPGGTEFTLGADAVPQVYGLDSLTFYEVINGDTIQLKEGFHFTGDLAVSQIRVTEPVSGCSTTVPNFSVNVLDPASFGFSASVNPEPGVPGDNQTNTLLSNTIDVDFCAGEQLLLSGYSDNGDIGYITSFTSSGNVTYDGVGLPPFAGPSDISATNAPTFFSGVYGGALGYGLTSGTTGTVNQVFTPYVDNDNNGSFTPGDCEGAPMYLNYHVYAIPTVTATPSATAVCKGGAVSVVFSGNYTSGVTYNWSNSNTTIGLAASGSGNISFNGINNTNVNQVATLTVTPVAHGCSGTPINVTITVHPEPVVTNITATVGGGMPESGNNITGPDTLYLDFCAGQTFSFSGYLATAGIGYLEQITAGTTNLLAAGGPIPVPRPQSDISAASAAAFFSGTAYGPYTLASGTYGWLSQVFTPYFDANTDGNYDPMTDCLSNKSITLIYRVYAPIVVNVTRNNAGEICSGDVIDYDITTTASQDVLVDIVLEANPGGGNPANLAGENPLLPTTKTLTINNLDPDSVAQTILNAMGSFDRGRVTLRVENARYVDGPTCAGSINHPQPNTQIYPKPILTDPADTTILAGDAVKLNFSPLAGLPSSNSNTAGFGVRARWSATTTAGVNVVGPNSGTTLIYDEFGVLTPGDDLVKTINLNNNTCRGTVTFTIIPEADGPTPGGGFDAVICAGDTFTVVVDVIKPLTLEHVYTGGPVSCGEEFTVSVEASNFCDINSVFYPFNWDVNAFQLVSFTTPIQPAGWSFNAQVNGPGELQLLFNDADINPPFGLDLPDGTVVLTYTLRAVGATGPYNIPDVALITEAFNSEFVAIPIEEIGISPVIRSISLALGTNPSVCPTDDNANLTFTNVQGNPNYYFIDFDAAAEAAGFPDTLGGTFVAMEGHILIPLPNGLQHGSYQASLVVSNTTYGCESATYLFSIVVDQMPPSASLLNPTITQDCFPEPAPNAAVQVINRMDNCPGPLSAVWVSDVANSGTGCGNSPKIITRTYRVIDQAGNSSTANLVQTITIQDNVAPTVSTAGMAAWYSSGIEAIVAAKAIAEATKNDPNGCTPKVGITVTVGSVDTMGCSATIRLIVTDACGNVTPTVDATYTTTIDRAKPTVTAGTIDDCYDEDDTPIAPYFADDYAVQAAIAATSATDDCDQNLSFTATVSGSDCDLVITVTAKDDCGKTNSVVYHTRVENDAPIFLDADSLALNGLCFDTEQEAEDAAIAATHAQDDCTDLNDIQYDAFVNAGCPAEIMVVATDFCGNLSTITYTGVHIDTQDPVIHPVNIYATCFKTLAEAYDSLAKAARPTDNCTSVMELLATASGDTTEIGPFNDGCKEFNIDITFTDNCGNEVVASFVTIVIDNIAPTVMSLPALSYTCIDDVDAPDSLIVVASDNCDIEDVIHLSTVLPTTCPGTGTRTYRAFDCAGNFKDVVQTININDNIKPTWDDPQNPGTPPAPNYLDRAFQCGDDISAALALKPVAQDNCGNATVTLVSDVPLNSCSGGRLRTWTAKDDCGNTIAAPFVQTITIVDNIAPGWTTMPNALNRSVECSDATGLAQAQALAPVASDACTGATLVKTPGVFVPGNFCPQEGTYTNTWVATDGCGNTSVAYTQVITITDNNGPNWVTPQGQPYPTGLNLTISCTDQNAYAFANNLAPTATDLCDGTVNLVKTTGLFVPGGSCPGEGTFTNTWTATDDCGNSSSAVFTQVITVIDNTPPTFDPTCQFMPLNLFTNPDGGPAANCSLGISLEVGDSLDYTSTWTVAGVQIAPLDQCIDDDCGPTSGIVAEVVSIVEETGLTVILGNQDTVECVRRITVSFQLSDACGNVQPTLFTCVYNIIDNTRPTVTGTSIAACYATESAAIAAALAATSASDLCTSTPNLVKKAVRTGTLCSSTITVTATDCAGNVSLPVVFNTRIDSGAPTMTVSVIPTCYPDVAAAQAAAINGTTIVDDCDNNLTITATTSGLCPATVTVTATDQCGQSRSVAYPGLCIGNSTSVTITTPAANKTVNCTVETAELNAWLANHGGAVASGSGIVWSNSPVVFGAPNCMTHSKSASVTFKATDGCGYMATTTATFTVQDLTPPTANLISNTNLSCVADTLPANINVVTGVMDNCDTNPTVTLFANTKTGTGCAGNPLVIARTYLVTDDYCNTTTVTQMITVVDNVAPTFSAPANITVNVDANCNYVATTNITGDVTNEADNCTPSGPMLQAYYTDVVNAGTPLQNPKYTITRTWQLTDACGNTAIPKVQTITVQDLINPTIAGCPASMTLSGSVIEGLCGATYGGQSTPAYQDNCTGATLGYNLSGATSGSGTGAIPGTKVFLEGTTTVTYTVTDAVGNTAACSFTITVNCLTISGRIIWDHDDASGVKDATVKLSQGVAQLGSDLSDTNGVYDLSVPAAGIFRITPVKNINRLNCQPGGACNVNAADATRILNHINFTNAITDPYKKVCADVNRSGVITNVDANLITQSIAGNPTALALFNVFWRFTPTDYVMPATAHQNVPAFPEFKDVTVGAVDVTGVDFFGMKIGDVDATWANPQNTPDLAPLVWVLQDQTLVAGTEMEVVFAASNFNDFASYQLALDFDPTQLQYLSFQPMGALSMNQLDNFGAYHADMGELRNVWAGGTGTTLEEGTQVFRLKFKVLTGGQKLSQVLKIDNAQIDSKAFNAALVPAEMKLVFTSSVSTDTPMELSNLELQLMQNRPNPFTDATTIGFILPEACEAHIRILDISGRELTSYDRKYTAGYHELDFRMENAASYGILFCELVTPQGKRTIKMITTK